MGGKQVAGKGFSPAPFTLQKKNSKTVQDCCRTTEQTSFKEEDLLSMTNYDDTIAFLGQWGRFQQVVFFLLCASVVPNGFGAFTLVFLTDIPAHHCLVPDVSLTEDWREAIIPVKVGNCWISCVNMLFNSRAHKRESTIAVI